jgi:hypothetical protein
MTPDHNARFAVLMLSTTKERGVGASSDIDQCDVLDGLLACRDVESTRLLPYELAYKPFPCGRSLDPMWRLQF